MRICSVPSCDIKHYGMGFCNKHYQKWRLYGDPLGGRQSTGRMELADRLNYYTNKTDTCWNWNSANSNGYGVLIFNGKLQGAHRLSWMVKNGDIPKGMHVLHKCDNPSCINPDHLFIGTHKDNMVDRCEKGRTAKGEESGPAKLSEKDVVEIRSLLEDKMKIIDIAQMYNVSDSTISLIKSGKNWSWLDNNKKHMVS